MSKYILAEACLPMVWDTERSIGVATEAAVKSSKAAQVDVM